MEEKKTLSLKDGSTAEYVISTAQYENRDMKTGREKGIDQFTEYRATITDANNAKYALKVFRNLSGEWETAFQYEEGTTTMKEQFKEAINDAEGSGIRNG